MRTVEFNIKVNGSPAKVIVDFSDDPTKPIGAIQLQYGRFVAAGFDNVKECLGNQYDALISWVLTTEKDDRKT